MLELPDLATREHNDMAATVAAYEEALGRGCKIPGGMCWHKVFFRIGAELYPRFSSIAMAKATV